MDLREMMTLVRRLVRARSKGRARGPVQIHWRNLLPLLGLLLVLFYWIGWRTSPFERACVDLAPGTPIAEAARRLEAAGGTPYPSGDDPAVRAWDGTRLYPWISCLVGIDRRERVEWTRFDKVYIHP